MKKKFLEDIEKIIDKHINEIIEFRRDIHKYPELGNFEFRTAAKIAEKLEKLPLETKTKISGEGIISCLYGNKTGKTILFRGDMDALPMNENSGLKFASQVPNVMHSCGHDIHLTIVLGTAIVLSEIKDKLSGNIKFMFQPAEECSPIGGAKGMIKRGVLESPKVDEAFGLHILDREVGSIEFTPGVASSKSDNFVIEINGKSSHGSMPSEGKDSIVAAANIINSIQSIISRNLSLDERAVITIGTINGGTRYNVVSDYVKLEGTVRSFSETAYIKIRNRLEKIVRDIPMAYECEGILKYEEGYDFIYNDLNLSKYIEKSMRETLGNENVVIKSSPLPAGEDFSFISKKVPSVFMWLGTKDESNEGRCTLHNPNFIASEKSIREGIKILCKIALERTETI
ncbi:M20 metallopeptidase family protein [Cetobacterium sp.]|uniref:M20 metallopeptidase family protein n=1 Tax=Cetobacterium sp. TaxID=2071632 RepID=UPI003EE70762